MAYYTIEETKHYIMVLLISNESDQSTNDVIDWLRYYKVDWKRINGEDFINGAKHSWAVAINKNEENLEQLLDSSESIWFRRFYPNYESIANNFSNYLDDELKVFKDYLLFNKTNILGNSSHRINKLIALSLAKEVGIQIPASRIVNNKRDLIRFIDEYKYIITKPISEILNYERNNEDYTLYTNEMLSEYLDKVPEHFFPTLVQEKIIKKFEIRTFFWQKKCYSMAIFSQENENTKVDFRRYDSKRPNRNVPYKLAKDFEEQIISLMQKLGLNSGSIDLIKDIKGNLIFLEVNPNGQFGMVSYPCNYNLEKIIANELMC